MNKIKEQIPFKVLSTLEWKIYDMCLGGVSSKLSNSPLRLRIWDRTTLYHV